MTLNNQPEPNLTPSGDPWLLTPGPLTTSLSVKQAMLHDYGSRDLHFIDVNRRMRERLIEIVNGQGTHECVPLQGSGTFVVEAMIGSFVPADGKLLILINGAYGERIAKICKYYKRETVLLEFAEDAPVCVAQVAQTLAQDKSITHVAAVYCETTSGVLNPIEEIAQVVAKHERSLLIDAMSAFGALPLDASATPFDAVVASSNKCLEAVPGVGFCIARKDALENTKDNAPSLSLDLYDQWTVMEKTAQWRFTPPTHAILAFNQALNEYEKEGGVSGRKKRYSENCLALVDGMRGMGFQTLLSDAVQAPIIITFLSPADPNYNFEVFYEALRKTGYVIYPGKLTNADTFRIGCIGSLGVGQINRALKTVEQILHNMGVLNRGPVQAVVA